MVDADVIYPYSIEPYEKRDSCTESLSLSYHVVFRLEKKYNDTGRNLREEFHLLDLAHIKIDLLCA